MAQRSVGGWALAMLVATLVVVSAGRRVQGASAAIQVRGDARPYANPGVHFVHAGDQVDLQNVGTVSVEVALAEDPGAFDVSVDPGSGVAVPWETILPAATLPQPLVFDVVQPGAQLMICAWPEELPLPADLAVFSLAACSPPPPPSPTETATPGPTDTPAATPGPPGSPTVGASVSPSATRSPTTTRSPTPSRTSKPRRTATPTRTRTPRPTPTVAPVRALPLAQGVSFVVWHGKRVTGADRVRRALDQVGLAGAWSALAYPVPGTDPLAYRWLFPRGASGSMAALERGKVYALALRQATVATWPESGSTPRPPHGSGFTVAEWPWEEAPTTQDLRGALTARYGEAWTACFQPVLTADGRLDWLALFPQGESATLEGIAPGDVFVLYLTHDVDAPPTD